MHHHEAPRARGAGGDGLHVPGGDAAQVDEVHAHSRGIEHRGRALGDGGGGAPRHDGDVIAAVAHRGVAGHHGPVRALHARRAQRVVEAGLRVQDERGPIAVEGGLEHARGILRGAGHGHVEPGDVGEGGLHRLGVERAEAGPVGAAGGEDHHGGRPCAGRAPVDGGQFRRDLVVGEREEVGELHHRHRAPSREGAADRGADDGRLAEWRVGDPPGVGGRQPSREAEHVALGVLDVLARERYPLVGLQAPRQHVAHGLEHGARGSVGQLGGRAGARDHVGGHRADGPPRCHGVVRGDGPGRGRAHLGLHLAVEGHEVVGRHTLGDQVVAERCDGVARPRGRTLGVGAVHRLIVGIGVMREALHLGHEHHGTPGLADVLHGPRGHDVERHRVAAVRAHDRRAKELARGPGNGVVDRAAAGVGGDRVAVVLDPEEHGQAFARGLADGLHHLALLRGAVAHARHHDGAVGVVGHLARHAHGVQQPVAGGHGHGEHVKLGVVQECGHLPASGVGSCGGEQAIEEPLGLDAAPHQQRARSVVRLQPVLRAQVVGEHRRRLVPGTAELEEGLAALHELLLHRIDPARAHHGPEGRERSRPRRAGLLCCGAQLIADRRVDRGAS